MTDTKHMLYVPRVLQSDEDCLKEKEKSYQGSWKKRGGVGAFMMLARKWDRIETAMEKDLLCDRYDILSRLIRDDREEGLLDDIRDLRRYLVLVEAEYLRLIDDSEATDSSDDSGRKDL